MIRRWAAAILVAAVAAIPLMPQEHMHERDDHGHHEALVHRHAEAHGIGHHDVDHEGVVDDDDALVAAIAPAYTVSARVALALTVVLTPLLEMAPAADVSHYTTPDRTRPIHGPPRLVRSLRAPPSSSFL